ncbi:MAG: hypothetical protein IKM08_09285 [Clostridia bacterium]|nr:hypothetical protein [Clostridia bacterium]
MNKFCKKERLERQWLCAMLAVLLSLALFACTEEPGGSTEPLSPGLSMIEGEPVHDSGVAMRTDHFTVTPGMMAYFFYGYGGTLIGEMEKQVPYDSGKSLHDQNFKDGLSFYDVLMNSTLQKVSEMLIYCEAARAQGIGLSDAQRASVESAMTSLRVEAASYNMELDPYLQRFYGPLITAADLQRVYEYEALAATHSAAVTKTLEDGITAEQIAAFVAEHGLDNTTASRNLSYLAIAYVGGQPNESAVSGVMDALRGAPAAATLKESGVGSYGEEQNLAPDNTGVSAISEWLFSDGRSVGDHGRVETSGATYILIYTGNGMSFAEVSARMSLYDSAYANWYNGWVEQLTFGYNYDILDSYDIS